MIFIFAYFLFFCSISLHFILLIIIWFFIATIFFINSHKHYSHTNNFLYDFKPFSSETLFFFSVFIKKISKPTFVLIFCVNKTCWFCSTLTRKCKKNILRKKCSKQKLFYLFLSLFLISLFHNKFILLFLVSSQKGRQNFL